MIIQCKKWLFKDSPQTLTLWRIFYWNSMQKGSSLGVLHLLRNDCGWGNEKVQDFVAINGSKL